MWAALTRRRAFQSLLARHGDNARKALPGSISEALGFERSIKDFTTSIRSIGSISLRMTGDSILAAANPGTITNQKHLAPYAASRLSIQQGNAWLFSFQARFSTASDSAAQPATVAETGISKEEAREQARLRSNRGVLEFICKEGLAGPMKAGRPWRTSELRLKSFEDLHKLWFVLAKERAMLWTEKEWCRSNHRYWAGGKFKLLKIKISMARLKHVVNERLRSYKAAQRLLLQWEYHQNPIPPRTEEDFRIHKLRAKNRLGRDRWFERKRKEGVLKDYGKNPIHLEGGQVIIRDPAVLAKTPLVEGTKPKSE